jgi:dipeptidase E
MKLLLASLGLTQNLMPHMLKLVSPSVGPVLVVQNASDWKGYAAQQKLRQFDRVLEDNGFEYRYLDLREFFGRPSQLASVFDEAAMLYVQGGNSFYLRSCMRKANLDELLPPALDNGLVCAGGSAGSLVLGPTLRHLELGETLDAVISLSDDVVWDGLGVIDFVPLPHWDSDRWHGVMREVRARLKAEGTPVRVLTDAQAIFVNGGEPILVQ